MIYADINYLIEFIFLLQCFWWNTW